MSYNLYARLRKLLPTGGRLLVGTVVEVGTDAVTIELPDGARLRARGIAGSGDRVYVRDGLVEGPAPNLPVEVIEV